MDVFDLREGLIEDFSSYVRSFINIGDGRVKDKVDAYFNDGLLWPEPRIQLNPSFERGTPIADLVGEGVLHPECELIFRRDKTGGHPGEIIQLHKHQEEAIRAAATRANYVLTTGTGSGKSLAYIVPIVDRVLRQGSGGSIKAIVVYPMNALANSQEGELAKFLCDGYPDGSPPVTFKRYTGQESEDEKQAIITDPPDILLTNYVMLELILTRPQEGQLIGAAKGLDFLVFDELHTYRGRQGADVALLARRVREVCDSAHLQCVGTSATLAGGGSLTEQRERIAKVATQIFGVPVEAPNVIGETLRRTTHEADFTDPAVINALRERVNQDGDPAQPSFSALQQDPLAQWVESTFGIMRDGESGIFIRRRPRPIEAETAETTETTETTDGAAQTTEAAKGPNSPAAEELAQLTQTDPEYAAKAIRQILLKGNEVKNPETGFPVFAFKLHQFIGRGTSAYASLEAQVDRYITTEPQQYVPGDREKILLPLAFCRNPGCGQEYYVVYEKSQEDSGQFEFTPRELNNRFEDKDSVPAYLYVSDANPWPSEPSLQAARLPEDWIEGDPSEARVKRDRKKDIPRPIHVGTDGVEVPPGEGVDCAVLKAPFRFCISCGITYSAKQRSDFAKLGTLSSEGRSTATTVLSLALVERLREDQSLRQDARKLLSFTDDRQDASLQAGHFNDFIQTGMIRAALFNAVESAGPDGLAHDVLAQRVLDELGLDLEDFASEPEVKYAAADETRRAMRDVLGYRLYQDLKRGWRVTSPNLEQCGLLKIEYSSLDELCANQEEWDPCHPLLKQATPETRVKVATTLLQFMRTELLIKVSYLDPSEQDRIRNASAQRLRDPWGFDEGENLEISGMLYPRASTRRESSLNRYGSSRSLIGQYLRRKEAFPDAPSALGADEVPGLLENLLENLRKAGLVERVAEGKEGEPAGYQLVAAGMRWVPGDGRPVRDELRTTGGKTQQSKDGEANQEETNQFFADFYRTAALTAKGLEAHEHTAQVPYQLREEREAKFKTATLPILYCSPTMELGVDIADLNAVHMRNVPPSPANYAQRSGRAGRQGQPAIVVTYCTAGSPHDQYYFRRQDAMISGEVSLPRLDLHNEDLIRSHIQAIWLRATGVDLHKSLKDILDLEDKGSKYPLKDHVVDAIESDKAAANARAKAEVILGEIDLSPGNPDWYSEHWLDDVIKQAPKQFDRAADRWRELYFAAQSQHIAQNEIIGSAASTADARKTATRLRNEAEQQIKILLSDEGRVSQSDFYSYRYFASQGFLPGYSFPRLPISAYVPARDRKLKRGNDEYLSRPRFLAISEFGPRALVYHEGAKYQINGVIFAGSKDTDEMNTLTTTAKLCEMCGYIHQVAQPPGPDTCNHCGSQLDIARHNLFRMRNATTKRRQRINSDEEERLRLGYEIHSFFKFGGSGNSTYKRIGEIRIGGGIWGQLSYGSSATIWRVNAGWRRRKVQEKWGFKLDTKNGYWAKNDELSDDEDPGDPMSKSVSLVVPYVDDKKNCLLVEPGNELGPVEMRSLQAALSAAIGIVYEIEENEIAGETLPSGGEPQRILFYEAAEGGAGVLRLLVDEPGALAAVAAKALEICHFDLETGEDHRRASSAKEDCEAACYNCLMTYRNQRDHKFLDRKAVRDVLIELTKSEVSASPGALSRAEHRAMLEKLCDSQLERDWLDFIDTHNYDLPDAAQRSIDGYFIKPDFFYEPYMAAVFIDGPVHDYKDITTEDSKKRDALKDAGYTVIAFGYDKSEWPEVAARYPEVFGKP